MSIFDIFKKKPSGDVVKDRLKLLLQTEQIAILKQWSL